MIETITGNPTKSEKGNKAARFPAYTPIIDDQARKILTKLRNKYGDPYRYGKNGKITGFNERFWAGVIKEESLLVYEPDLAMFWIYNPATGIYSRATREYIRELIGDRIFQAAKDENKPEIRNLVTIGRLDTIVKALVGIAERREFFADRPSSIHLANGMVLASESGLEFEDGFNPEYRSRNSSPFSYNPDATCDRFHNELLIPMLPNPEDRIVLQKWLGLALSGDNPAQRILLFDGTPGRGKGVIQRIFTGIVGRQNSTELRTSHLGERFEINRFVGRTLLHASDVPGDFLMQKWASILKSLVGGDYLDTEAKGSNESHEITGNFNVMIVSNTRLRCRLDGDAGAWRRRLIILRTESPPVEKRIPNFERALLRVEGDGILQWALEGYHMALKDLNECGDLILSQEQQKRVDGLLAESNALEIFVRDSIRRSTGSATTVDDILSAFAEYCADRGWQMSPQAQLQRALTDLMLQYHQAAKSNSIKTSDGTKRGFRGITISNGEPE
ncbi:MAG: DUF5906 domain-containing protein [Puniceicoccaceae bacterium]